MRLCTSLTNINIMLYLIHLGEKTRSRFGKFALGYIILENPGFEKARKTTFLPFEAKRTN